jgi:hypothetical protein
MWAEARAGHGLYVMELPELSHPMSISERPFEILESKYTAKINWTVRSAHPDRGTLVSANYLLSMLPSAFLQDHSL